MAELTTEEKIRYDRQLIMPEIGEAGQVKLKAARLFLAGLGGLGSISAYLLTAAGVGYLRMVDGDRVALNNLNRQILFDTSDVGHSKSDLAAGKLGRLNPACNLDPVRTTITQDNVVDLVSDCHLIVDATDNLAVRLALNRAALTRNIPLVFGGIEGMHGMVTTIVPGLTPCLACLFGAEMDRGQAKPVIGPLPGLVASIQALEAIKLIVDTGDLLSNRLLRIEASTWRFKETMLDKNPACPVCGSSGLKAAD